MKVDANLNTSRYSKVGYPSQSKSNLVSNKNSAECSFMSKIRNKAIANYAIAALALAAAGCTATSCKGTDSSKSAQVVALVNNQETKKEGQAFNESSRGLESLGNDLARQIVGFELFDDLNSGSFQQDALPDALVKIKGNQYENKIIADILSNPTKGMDKINKLTGNSNDINEQLRTLFLNKELFDNLSDSKVESKYPQDYIDECNEIIDSKLSKQGKLKNLLRCRVEYNIKTLYNGLADLTKEFKPELSEQVNDINAIDGDNWDKLTELYNLLTEYDL